MQHVTSWILEQQQAHRWIQSFSRQ
jgi:hypothetical protein